MGRSINSSSKLNSSSDSTSSTSSTSSSPTWWLRMKTCRLCSVAWTLTHVPLISSSTLAQSLCLHHQHQSQRHLLRRFHEADCCLTAVFVCACPLPRLSFISPILFEYS